MHGLLSETLVVWTFLQIWYAMKLEALLPVFHSKPLFIVRSSPKPRGIQVDASPVVWAKQASSTRLLELSFYLLHRPQAR